MQDVYADGVRLRVSESLGKGGEGAIFALADHPHEALKLYRRELRGQRERKVRAMVQSQLATRTKLASFPTRIVTTRAGAFLGFVMNRVSGHRALHELYSPKSRLQHFPEVDYRFLIRAAQNVARAVGSIHNSGCVIGDLNHSGILVAHDATVLLIDADSFQFRSQGELYPCVVGVPEFLPPELHGRSLASVERTASHDNFSLAVAIFQLLFMGRHPYAGVHAGTELSMGEAIAGNLFAYSRRRRNSTSSAPPPGALTLDVFPGYAQDAFEEAFGLAPSDRPDAAAWIRTMVALENSLQSCSNVATHYFPPGATACCWCDLASRGGVEMFPNRRGVGAVDTSASLNLATAIQAIRSFHVPNVAELLPAVSPPEQISTKLRESISAASWTRVAGGIVTLGGIAGFFVAPSVWLLFVGAIIFGLSMSRKSKAPTDEYLQAYRRAHAKVQQSLDSFARQSQLWQVLTVQVDMVTAVDAYERHSESLDSALARLQATRETRQLNAYLDTISIRSAHISGIGVDRTATLVSFGVETAADVTPSKIHGVPGFGEVLTGRLINWRRTHERDFRYDPNSNPQDRADQEQLKQQHAEYQARLAAQILKGYETLSRGQSQLPAIRAAASSDETLMTALRLRAQAERDLLALGASVPSLPLSIPKVDSPQQIAPFVTPLLSSQSQSTSAPTKRAPIQRVTSTPHCPRCGKLMVVRVARRGTLAGQQFWGCPNFPRCHGTRRYL